MDFKQIQELIKLVNGSNIGEVSVEQKDFKVTIKQKEEHITQVMAPMQQTPLQQFSPPQNQQQLPPQSTEKPQDAIPASANTITIKSPMIGTQFCRNR
jgi:acetyl-CoA carboxylase biotin carboxyl carrier protein